MLQIWPVLCCLGASHAQGGTPCLTATAQWPSLKRTPHAQSSSSSSHTGGVVTEVRLRPVTVWVGLPLLQRLTEFFGPLASSMSQPPG